MDYLLTFLEGIVTFVSPCLLPMLPIYISYFAGGAQAQGEKRKTAVNALGFVLGFTVVFLLLGAAAGTFGRFIKQYQTVFDLLGGALLVLLGLNFMELFSVGWLNRTVRPNVRVRSLNFFTSVLLGFVFSIGWTPCVGAFLGSALMLAANSREAFKGILLLLLFSLGLGVPFVLSALLIDSLKSTFEALKRHMRAIRIVSGLLLVSVGVLLMLGRLGAFLSLLTFR